MKWRFNICYFIWRDLIISNYTKYWCLDKFPHTKETSKSLKIYVYVTLVHLVHNIMYLYVTDVATTCTEHYRMCVIPPLLYIVLDIMCVPDIATTCTEHYRMCVSDIVISCTWHPITWLPTPLIMCIPDIVFSYDHAESGPPWQLPALRQKRQIILQNQIILFLYLMSALVMSWINNHKST